MMSLARRWRLEATAAPAGSCDQYRADYVFLDSGWTKPFSEGSLPQRNLTTFPPGDLLIVRICVALYEVMKGIMKVLNEVLQGTGPHLFFLSRLMIV